MNNKMILKKSVGGGINRDSGIELLKIIAIFLIVISHVVQTLGTNYGLGTYNDYVVELGHSTTDITILILTSLRYFGNLGNTIFFISTAWFMVDKQPRSKKKILTLAIDVWAISIIMLFCVLIIRSGNIDVKMILKSFFPIVFENNWYISCYIIFCLVHPFLNEIINNSSQQRLFRMTLVLIFIYIFLDSVCTAPFSSSLMIWIAIYFLIAYYKKYMQYLNNNKWNIAILIFGIVGNTCAILLTNFVGFKVAILSEKVEHWNRSSNPFLIMIAFGLFNIFKQIKLKNGFINYISSLSLYIYLFHENLLFRTYCRSAIWHEIYIRFGYDYILSWVLAYSIILLAISAIVSIIYQKTVHKIVQMILNKGYDVSKEVYLKAERIFLRTK